MVFPEIDFINASKTKVRVLSFFCFEPLERQTQREIYFKTVS